MRRTVALRSAHARALGVALAFASSLASVSPARAAEAPAAPAPRPAWALAIHGGAGSATRDMPEERRRAYVEALTTALGEGRARLARGDRAIDVVTALVEQLEDDPLFNAGRGAVFNADGRHELDASIMDGSSLACGAVGAVGTVRHPIRLARAVMEQTPHVLVVGAGAERLAAALGLEQVANDWFSTDRRREELVKEKARATIGATPPTVGVDAHGTVGAVALDRHGHLAAATSTGGRTNKLPGRVGDTAVIGAGTFADDRSVAVSCTGNGEEFIRHGIARELDALVRHTGLPLEEAARRLVVEVLKPGDGGLVAVGRDGAIALVYNTESMLRGAANALGRFEVGIWSAQP